jgi:photosystem II protein PsbQ
MKSYRSILALILAMVTTFLVSCGSPTAVKPPTYTAEKIVQIQQLASSVEQLRDKMSILETSIQNQDWTDVGSFIHGPLGEVRRLLSSITRELLPQDQKEASAIAKDLFTRLESIDVASTSRNYQVAAQNYQAALQDFERFLQLVPEQSE